MAPETARKNRRASTSRKRAAPRKTAAPLEATLNHNGVHPNGNLDRAEQVIDRLGKRVGQWVHEASVWALSTAARAREEAEDIWADAQNIRRGGSA